MLHSLHYIKLHCSAVQESMNLAMTMAEK